MKCSLPRQSSTALYLDNNNRSHLAMITFIKQHIPQTLNAYCHVLRAETNSSVLTTPTWKRSTCVDPASDWSGATTARPCSAANAVGSVVGRDVLESNRWPNSRMRFACGMCRWQAKKRPQTMRTMTSHHCNAAVACVGRVFEGRHQPHRAQVRQTGEGWMKAH